MGAGPANTAVVRAGGHVSRLAASRRPLWILAVVQLAFSLVAACASAHARYVRLPGGMFVSALAGPDENALRVRLKPFWMRIEPVTNAEYLRFVRTHPQWQRGRALPLFTGPDYLRAWSGPLTLGPAIVTDAPVTQVSWFAARAFCASEHARLPTWFEWEYAAAADAKRTDARRDRQRTDAIIAAIQASTGQRPGPVARRQADSYGVRDLNRLLWEWTDDYAAMFPSSDPRDPGTGPTLALCGGAALAFRDPEQFDVILRISVLAQIKPNSDGARIGFRCVRDRRRRP